MEPVASPAPHAGVPYARSIIAMEPEHFATLRRAVELLFRVTHTARYQALVDTAADRVALHDPGNFGVFMGYDFHLTGGGPRLIEINTNAGGALLNGLHNASLCDVERLGRVCSEIWSIDTLEERLVGTFHAELAAARGADARLRTVAIADENPEQQFLYPEFVLFRELLARFGVEAFVCDTAELERGRHGDVELRGTPIDLVYLRDTDFLLASARAAVLRAAYLEGSVVITPAPREHHLLADKRRLAIFSSRSRLAALGVAAEDAEFLAGIVPEAHLLGDLDAEETWRRRRDWVFKPHAGFGSKAVYRGDKLTRSRFQEICSQEGYVAQRAVQPGAVQVATEAGPRPMKFDVRAYAYRDQVLLLGARAYRGQVTNLRSPGGGFSAICVVRDPGGVGPGG